jgi:hypothetical protein
MRPLLVILILLGTAVPADAQTVAAGTRRTPEASGMVWGQVLSEKTGAPLRFAVVEIISAGLQPISTPTDINGIYVLRHVPAGRRLLRATHIDHAPNEVEIVVVADKQHVIDFHLGFRPVRLTAITADAARLLPTAIDTVAVGETELGPATVRAMESTPGVAELGLAEAAREVPGHEPVDPGDVLYVRGSSADLKLVLLNGAPVYAPFHVGGLIHALDADVLRSATLHAGGAPARYDGGLSYVMDLESRSGRSVRPHGEIGIDMLSARLVGEGPIGSRVAVLGAARTVHGAGTGSFMADGFPYGYGDVLGRVDVLLAADHVITATGFGNDETVELDTLSGQRQSASWGNRAWSVRYRGGLGDSELLGTVARGRFRTMLPLGSRVRPLTTEGTAYRSRAALDIERPFAGGRLFWGGSVDWVEFEHRAFPSGGSRDSTVMQSGASGQVTGVYGEAAYTILPRVRVRGGVRADVFSREDGVRLTPRASATVLLTDRAALTLSAGMYRQYVRAPEESLIFLGVAPDSGGAPALSVATATHVVLGLSQDFGEGIRLGLEGFFKEFEGLRSSRATKTAASGVDLWLRRSTGELTGWLGYSLAWVWAVEGRPVLPRQAFSGRHLVSAGLVGPVIAGSTFDVRVSYGAGLPYTAIPEPDPSSPVFSTGTQALIASVESSPETGPVPSEPEAPFFRVDAQVSRNFSGVYRDFSFQVMPYVKVINALNRRDAIFYHYSRDVGHAQPLADLPIVPVIGMEWRF